MRSHKHSPSSYARILFRYLGLSEDNCDEYFKGTDVSYKELMTLDGTIARDDMVNIYMNALAISGREDLGLLVGTQLNLPTHGPLGVAAFSGPDLRTAVTLLAQYGQTRVEFFNTTVSEHPAGLKIHFAENFDLAELRLFITETVLSGLFSAIEFFVGAGQFKGQAYFSYAKPSYWQKYHDAFGDNIQFDHSSTEIIISSSLLSVPSPVADPDLHKEAVAICEQQLKEITADQAEGSQLSIEQRVSTLIFENPGKLWTLNEVAEKLCMSSRTLIRKLDAEGTKFQNIRDEQAKKQAANYLTDASLSVESIGHLMGFSDVSSFRRSFKRWFGETPSQYMARVRGGEA
ncbi:MAG: AraC family transcriptional regulator ligand-binding domain-containing protein [Porticoccaceae bacterium]